MVDVVNGSLGFALGDELGPDLIIAAAGAGGSALLALREAYDEYCSAWRMPARPGRGNLSPYVPTYGRMSAPGGIELRTEYDFLDLDKVNRSVEALHLQLLYAHRVAMTNPFIYIHDRLRWFPGEDSEHFPQIRSMVVGYLTFLSQVSLLVSAGVLVLVEDGESTLAHGGTEETDPILACRQEVGALFDYEDFDLGVHEHEELAEMKKLAGVVLEQVVYMTSVAGRHRFDVDYFLGNRAELRSLNWLLKNRDRRDFEPFWDSVGWPSPGQNAGRNDLLRLLRLGSVDVPDFELRARDVIEVREDHAFETWRDHLGRALDAVSDAEEDALFGAAPDFDIVSQQLREGREEVQKLVASSGFLGTVRKGLRTMTVGGLASLVTAPLAPPGTGAFAAGVEGVLEIGLDLKNVKGRRSRRALLNHYLLFSRPAG